jgi:mRNA interferase RelE/StbE
MQVGFKKTFLKDFEQLSTEIQAKVGQVVFTEMPRLQSLEQLQNLKKLVGYQNFYRIRIGAYRLGFRYEGGKIICYRVLHRKEIYKYFP